MNGERQVYRSVVAVTIALGTVTLTGNAAEFRDCADCPQMVVVPAGTFTMGAPPKEADRADREGPQRRVTIGRDLAVGKYEVTREEFSAFVVATGYQAGDRCWVNVNAANREEVLGKGWRTPGFEQEERDPAVCIAWDDAVAYAAWLSRRTGRSYRLLSEAEWEYSARAGTMTARYWGEASDQACNYANVHDVTSKAINKFSWEAHACDDGRAHTAPVGSFRPNEFGAYDMLGNVYEWVADCWTDDYSGAENDGRARIDGDCSRHVLRGGAWNSEPAVVRAAARFSDLSGNRDDDVGFRVARAL